MTLCRVTALAAPLLEELAGMCMTLPDSDCNSEETGAEKIKYELQEETWLMPMEWLSGSPSILKYIHLSDNRLLNHPRKPFSPPPDLA